MSQVRQDSTDQRLLNACLDALGLECFFSVQYHTPFVPQLDALSCPGTTSLVLRLFSSTFWPFVPLSCIFAMSHVCVHLRRTRPLRDVLCCPTLLNLHCVAFHQTDMSQSCAELRFSLGMLHFRVVTCFSLFFKKNGHHLGPSVSLWTVSEMYVVMLHNAWGNFLSCPETYSASL